MSRTTEAVVPENCNKKLKRELSADRLSASWPFADEYRRICQAALAHPRSP